MTGSDLSKLSVLDLSYDFDECGRRSNKQPSEPVLRINGMRLINIVNLHWAAIDAVILTCIGKPKAVHKLAATLSFSSSELIKNEY